jgi:hypothetical protein
MRSKIGVYSFKKSTNFKSCERKNVLNGIKLLVTIASSSMIDLLGREIEYTKQFLLVTESKIEKSC